MFGSAPSFEASHRRAALTAWALVAALGLSACQGSISQDNGTGAVTQAAEEICTDGVDNNANSLVDCADPQCSRSAGCIAAEQPLQPLWGEACAEVSGDRGHTPVDLIVAVDGSASMEQEIEKVVFNLNNLASYLLSLRADLRVVLLGAHPKLCVQPPLGGPECGDAERFRHIKSYIGNDALRQIVELHPQYSGFLRPGAPKSILVVSDTNAEGTSVSWFDAQARSLGFAGYTFHSIVAFSEGVYSHPNGCPGAISEGKVYTELSGLTDGLTLSICEPRWDLMFGDLGRHVAGLISLPCSYRAPVASSSGQRVPTADLVQVNVQVDGQWHVAEQRSDATVCDQQMAWYREGDQVRLCPSVCHGLTVAEIKLLFGCDGAGQY